MCKSLMFAVLLGVASPALADDCKYVSGVDLGTVQFADKKAKFTPLDDAPIWCDYVLGDEGGSTMSCPGLLPMGFSFAGKELGENTDDLLIMENTAWYKVCAMHSLRPTPGGHAKPVGKPGASSKSP